MDKARSNPLRSTLERIAESDQPLPVPKKSVLWLLLLDAGLFMIPISNSVPQLDLLTGFGLLIMFVSIAYWGYLYFHPAYTRQRNPAVYCLFWPRHGVDLAHLSLVTVNLFFAACGILLLLLMLVKHSPSAYS